MDKKKIFFFGIAGVAAGVAGYVIGKRHRRQRQQDSSNRSVLILVNHDVVIYNFRLELVERLLAEGYEVQRI